MPPPGGGRFFCSRPPRPVDLSHIPFAGTPVVWNNGRFDVAIGVVPITWPNPAPYNPREMADDARKRLEHGLDHFGLVDTLVVADDAELLGGHQRLISEMRRGSQEIPVTVVFGLTGAERRAVNVLLNNPKAQGQWDMRKLSGLLSELDAHGFDATLAGYDEPELEKLLVDMRPDPLPDPAAAEQLAPDPGQTPGEPFAVVVVCVDAADQERTYLTLTEQGFTCKAVSPQ